MRSRGFSLVEALVTSCVLMFMLGVAALLVRDYARVLRADERKQSRRNALQALEQASTELRLAVAVSEPLSDGSLSSRVSFQRANSQVSTLPAVLPSPLPGSWTPSSPASLLTVVYQLQGTQLERRATGSGSSETTPLSSEVTGLAARFLPSGTLELEVSIDDNGVVRVLHSQVDCGGL
ncbi:MAG: type II secretion system protein [Candidatus Eremiobacterota bacterium]